MRGYRRKQVYVLFVVCSLECFLVNGLSGDTCIINGIHRCCNNNFNDNGHCKACSVGSESYDGVKCRFCKDGFFGKNCAEECSCDNNKICHHIDGCIEEKLEMSSVSFSGSSKGTNDCSKDVGYYVSLCAATIVGMFLSLVINRVRDKCAQRRKRSTVVTTQRSADDLATKRSGDDQAYQPQQYQYIDESRMVDVSSHREHDDYLDAYQPREVVTTDVNKSSGGPNIPYQGGHKNIYQPLIKESDKDNHEYKKCEFQNDNKDTLKKSIGTVSSGVILGQTF